MEQRDGKMPLTDLCALYQAQYQQNFDVLSYMSNLTDAVEVSLLKCLQLIV